MSEQAPVTPAPAPSPADMQAEINVLNAKVAAQEARRHPVSRFFSRIRASLPKLPTITVAGAAKACWGLWVTLSILGVALVPLTLHGCSSNPFTPGPSPIGEGNSLLVVYDASSRMDPNVQSALWSSDVWQYAGASLSTGPEGTAEARIFDVDADVSGEHPKWQTALAKAKGKNLPYVLITGKHSSFEGDLPKSKVDMIALVKKCFGGAKLPMAARPPPSEYVLTDANTIEAKAHGTGLATDRKPLPSSVLGAFDLPEMTDAEIEAAIVRKNADNSWLDNVRDRGNKGSRIPSRDQNGKGYCWAHSSTSASLLIRAQNNQPYSDLSAYAVACIIKGYRDEGGWGSESLDFIAQRGVPSSQFWPQQSMSRTNDNANTWANAKMHRVTEWIQPTTNRQLATCLCNNIPVVSDFNWWGHSVCSVRLKAWGPNGANLKTTIWNSWGDGWSAYGMGDLDGAKALPDAMVAPRVMTAAFAARKKEPPLFAMAP